MSWILHPGFKHLGRLADGECDPDEARRIREHLAGCARCREELEFFRELERTARKLRHPAPPAGLLEEILARREAGERVILPTSPPPLEEESQSKPVTVILVALLLLAGAAALVWSSGEATAGASTLRVVPELPRPGERLALEFRAASPLAGEERLRLRGWYRTAEEPPPRGTIGTYLEATLDWVKAGRFGGELWLPPGAVYAAFVVEDPEGVRVESKGGRPWEVLAHDETGRPLLPALRQKFRVEESRNAAAALETARTMTELYPDHPEGWFYRYVYEQLLFPRAEDSLRQSHGAQVQRLDSVLSRQEAPSATDVAALVAYAERLGNEDLATRWKERLLEEHPYHPDATHTRVFAAFRAHAARPDRLLGELEEEWRRSGSTSRFLVEQGFRAAVRAKEPAEVRSWGRRLLAGQPELAWLVADHMEGFPSLRAEAADVLRERVRSLATPARERREPGNGVAEQRRSDNRESWRLLARLGRILLDMDAHQAARDTLALAAAEGWDPELLGHLGQSYLQAGDTARALKLFALAAADPLADDPAEPPEEVEIEGSSWERLVGEARPELRRRILAESEDRPLNLGARLFTLVRTRHSLEELVGSPATLLVYCSPLALVCARNEEALAEAAATLMAREVRGFLILADSSGGTTAPASGLPVFLDSRGEVALAFKNWEIPQYLVVDRHGRVRFQHTDVRRALRQALAVAEEAERPR